MANERVEVVGIYSAYRFAVAGGYTGTEEEFKAALARLASIEAEATTLPEGSEATAAYTDGVLSFGIPRGNTGATGAQGEKGEKGDTGATGNGIASIAKTATEGLVDTYTITFTDGSTTTFEVTNGEDGSVTPEQMAAAIAAALENYATTDGTYEDMAVGELISSNTNEDTEPYIFRKTGGSVKAGKREYLDKIVGVSLVENQLLKTEQKSGTHTWNSDTTNYYYSMALPSDAQFKVYSNHKYFVSVNLSRSISGNNLISISLNNILGVTLQNGVSDGVVQGVKAATSDFTANYLSFNNYSGKRGFSAGDSASYDNLIYFDLTQAFGTTIADYICSLEQATEGAGVAWLKQYMDLNTYIPYTEPTLKHVEELVSHDTVGFNQWDEEGEVGAYGNNGGILVKVSGYPTVIRAKNMIKVFPNTTYAFYCDDPNYNLGFYIWEAEDLNAHITGSKATSSGRFTTYTTTAKASHLTFATRVGYGSTYKHDICVSILSERGNNIYEPYQKHSYPLDSSVILRGIPTLVGGKMVYDGDEYAFNGTINRRYGIVDLGTLNWTYTTSESVEARRRFYAELPDLVKNANGTAYTGGMVINAPYSIVFFKTVTTYQQMLDYLSATTGKLIWQYTTGSGTPNVCIRDSDYSDVASFKAAMSGVYLVYERATPTTETADPYRQIQICDPYGTEEFVGAEIPVGTVTEYPEDLTAKIEGLPWDLSMIAPIENGATASQAYTAGQYFLRNNVFCKALTAIASGATFTLNTNYTETTVAAEFYTALH